MLRKFLYGLISVFSTAYSVNAECSAIGRPLLHTEMDFHVYVNFQPNSPFDGLELFHNEASGYSQVFFTRRDGTQVHITSEPVFSRSDADIEAHVGLIDVVHDLENGVTSFSTEFPNLGQVEAEVRYNQRPSEQFGGLTDARNHGSRSMLPIMYRNKSGLVQTISVTLNGEKLDVPDETFGENFKAPSVYLTEGWQNVLLYVFDTEDGVDPDPAMAAFLQSKELKDLHLAPDGCDVQASLNIDANTETFVFSYGEIASISGRVEERMSEDARVVFLLPETPEWALERAVALVICDSGRMHMKVGEDALQAGCS